jgi:hypothetical protein
VIFLDLLVYLAMAKIAVLLLEDAAYAVRGKQSPRRQARRQQATQRGTDSGTPGAGRAGSTVAAADGYLAGLIEDATDRARARRRRAAARKAGARAVDGVVVDVDEAGRWYADCDVCGWSSRPYRIEANARGAGREHTRAEHPDQYTGPTADTDSNRDGGTDSAASPEPDQEDTTRPRLRVIPGGAQDEPVEQPAQPQPTAPTADPAPAPAPAPAANPAPAAAAGEPAGGDGGQEPTPGVVHTDEHPYCLTPCGPTCTARRTPVWGWRCARCGARHEGYATRAEAEAAAAAGHLCSTPPAGPDGAAASTRPLTEADVVRIRSELYGACAHRTVREGSYDQWCDNLVDRDDPSWPYCPEHQTSGADTDVDAGQHHPAATAATGPTTEWKELTVNLEATGPEEIRAAFGQAAEAAGERAEEVGGVAGVLTEAADRYEGLEMAPSTIGHLRDAAEQFAAAHAALNAAQEELQAALADFNSKDGAVAEVVADAGGNVASKEVLVG